MEPAGVRVAVVDGAWVREYEDGSAVLTGCAPLAPLLLCACVCTRAVVPPVCPSPLTPCPLHRPPARPPPLLPGPSAARCVAWSEGEASFVVLTDQFTDKPAAIRVFPFPGVAEVMSGVSKGGGGGGKHAHTQAHKHTSTSTQAHNRANVGKCGQMWANAGTGVAGCPRFAVAARAG
jgi:hypothetical protein